MLRVFFIKNLIAVRIITKRINDQSRIQELGLALCGDANAPFLFQFAVPGFNGLGGSM
jgi:hypothetical protein